MHYVYILECSDGSYYTGYTTDVARRLKVHNAGKGSNITRSKLPAVLVHQEAYRTKGKALRREAEIKSWPRAKKKELIEAVDFLMSFPRKRESRAIKCTRSPFSRG